MSKIRVAVVGAGAFGKNHLRVIHESDRAELVAVVDTDESRRADAAARYRCRASTDISELSGLADAAIVATPTSTHAEIGCKLMELGLDVLVEKPIAPDLESARRLEDSARRAGRVLQVGHLERFNPAVTALERIVTKPLFFEIHRLSEFSPRSLDVDVVLDLMIHDIEIVLALVRALPEEIRAAGISILSGKVDLANVRLAFPGGAVANLTASRVSTERVRKLRLFQPAQYISLDYARQDGVVFTVSGGPAGERKIGYQPLAVTKSEPLRLELDSFFECVQRRATPRVGGAEASRALEVALAILAKIEAHSRVVTRTLQSS